MFSGCATQPWSVLDGDGATAVDELRHDVSISAIDGQYFPDFRTRRKIQPGFHQVQVETTKPRTQRKDSFRTTLLNAEPCIRYLLLAQYSERWNTKDWTVVVKEQAPISDCVAPKKPEADETPTR